MSLVLALEPDPRQSALVRQTVQDHVGAEFVLADTRDAAMAAIGERLPDVILLTALLSPRDEHELTARLRALDGAGYVQTLTIPVLAGAAAKPPRRRRGLLSALTGQAEESRPAGCEPAVFAEEIRTYIARALELRAAAETARARVVAAPAPVSTIVAPRVEDVAAPFPPVAPADATTEDAPQAPSGYWDWDAPAAPALAHPVAAAPEAPAHAGGWHSVLEDLARPPLEPVLMPLEPIVEAPVDPPEPITTDESIGLAAEPARDEPADDVASPVLELLLTHPGAGEQLTTSIEEHVAPELGEPGIGPLVEMSEVAPADEPTLELLLTHPLASELAAVTTEEHDAPLLGEPGVGPLIDMSEVVPAEEPVPVMADVAEAGEPVPPAVEVAAADQPLPVEAEPVVELWQSLPEWSDAGPALASSAVRDLPPPPVEEPVEAAPVPEPVLLAPDSSVLAHEPAREAPTPAAAAEPERESGLDGRWIATAIDALKQDLERARREREAAAAALAEARSIQARAAEAAVEALKTVQRQAPAVPAAEPAAAAPQAPKVRGQAEKPKGRKAVRDGARPANGHKVERPVQDEWGIYDPARCGFGALYARLEEDGQAEADKEEYADDQPTLGPVSVAGQSRPRPLALWVHRADADDARPASASRRTTSTQPADAAQGVITGLRIPAAVASVGYARGARIRKVRVPKGPDRPRGRRTGEPIVILSRRLLASVRTKPDSLPAPVSRHS